MDKRYTERVEVVDATDYEITTAYRFQIDEYPEKLRAKASRVIAFNEERTGVWVQRRAAGKVNGLLLDVGVAETVLKRESYLHAAKRGMLEEMLYGREGIPLSSINVEHLCTLITEDLYPMRNYEIYAGTYDAKRHGPPSLDPEETKSWQFFSMEQLEKANKKDFTPAGWIMTKMALRYLTHKPIEIIEEGIEEGLEEWVTEGKREPVLA